MLRALTADDYAAAYAFCEQDAPRNLYFLGNLEALGIASDLCQFWGSFDAQGQINGVLMRYMDGWNIADAPGCDYDRMGEVLDAHPAGAARLQDNPQCIPSLLPFIHRYRASAVRTETLCELDPADFHHRPARWPARRATLADLDALCRFYADADDMSRSPRGVERPLQSGRVFVVERDDSIVSAALTNAETSALAMIGGVYTPPEHRSQGYASAAVATLCQSLLADGKRLVLYYDHPAAGAIYHRLGFHQIGFWRSVWLELAKQ